MNTRVDPNSVGLVVPEDIISVEIDRHECKSFATFVQRAWHVVEPQTKLKWGWALDAMCEHLEAVTVGEITKLLMNVPPGMMKSKLCGVFWPAWEWGPMGMPHIRFLGTSHKQELSVRDNLLCRRLITSAWYQQRWGDKFKITSDQNEKKKFENDKTGFREAMAFTSMTGSRGDRVLLDDPQTVDKANSVVELENVRTTFKEALPTRVNDETSAIVVIMQRLNMRDVSGVIIDEGYRYEKLILPMYFEPDRRCVTSIGFKDPRTEKDELLFPQRFSEAQIQELVEGFTSYAVAGQLQQRPVPREGGMFKRAWFEGKVIDEVPKGTVFWRHWDLAATKEPGAARTVGVKMGKAPDGRIIVAHVKKLQDEGYAVRRTVLSTAQSDGVDVRVSLPQDPGQAGKVQKQDYSTLLHGFKFKIEREVGDKEERAEPFAAQCEAGNVYLLQGDWIDDYLDELCLFPGGKWKDQVDASSGAYNRLTVTLSAKTSTSTTKAY